MLAREGGWCSIHHSLSQFVFCLCLRIPQPLFLPRGRSRSLSLPLSLLDVFSDLLVTIIIIIVIVTSGAKKRSCPPRLSVLSTYIASCIARVMRVCFSIRFNSE